MKQINFLSIFFNYSAIVSLLFFAVGLKHIDNYINWGQYSLLTLFSGTLLAIILFQVICRFLPKARKFKNSKGIGLLFPMIFTFSFCLFGLGILINESSSKNIEDKNYRIQDMGESGSKQRDYYLFIGTDDGMKRLSFGKDFYGSHKIGDTINVCLITGMLNFKYYKISPKN